MNKLNRQQFMLKLSEARISKRLIGNLKFTEEIDWQDAEMIAIADMSGNEGVLLIDVNDLTVLPYELRKRLGNQQGKLRSVICDLCLTWQAPGKAAQITFRRKSDRHSFTYLCCADLQCSRHVRGKTPEAELSKTQIKEDIDVEHRIERLQEKLNKLIATLAGEKSEGL